METFDFTAPRTAWQRIDHDLRGAVDEGLAAGQKPRMIIIHSTGSQSASAPALHDNHQRVRGLADGLAYHFVIGNGQGMPDGKILVGPRWRQNLPSAGLTNPKPALALMEVALVGNFNKKPPTRAQIEALDELLDYLAAKTGPLPVRLHREVENSPRGCPGAMFPVKSLRAAFAP